MRLLVKINLLILSVFLMTGAFSISAFAQMSQEELDQWLLNASGSGDVDSVEFALSAGADVYVRSEQGCIPLMNAIGACGDLDRYHHSIVSVLLDEEVDLSRRSKILLNKLLLRASEYGDEKGVNAALDAGASVHGIASVFDTNRFLSTFNPPLFLASKNGHEDIVRRLVIAGASINHEVSFLGQTALDIARENGHEHVARILQDAGAVSANDVE